MAEDELAVAIERLQEAGAIDDERFARRFAEDKRELRGWGPDRIAGALGARGIAEPLIEAAIEAEGAEALLERGRLRRRPRPGAAHEGHLIGRSIAPCG